jgi:hypothetical protein
MVSDLRHGHTRDYSHWRRNTKDQSCQAWSIKRQRLKDELAGGFDGWKRRTTYLFSLACRKTSKLRSSIVHHSYNIEIMVDQALLDSLDA